MLVILLPSFLVGTQTRSNFPVLVAGVSSTYARSVGGAMGAAGGGAAPYPGGGPCGVRRSIGSLRQYTETPAPARSPRRSSGVSAFVKMVTPFCLNQETIS